MNTFITIDPGSTNTVGAVLIEGATKPRVLRHIDGSGLCPSVVAYLQDGRIVVGREALRYVRECPQNVVQSPKRDYGTGKCYDTSAGAIRPENAQGDICRFVYDTAIKDAGIPGSGVSAVVVYPMGFTPVQRATYLEAIASRGVPVLVEACSDEATAAAMAVADAYGEDIHGKTILIMDLGGGTLDIVLAVCEMVDGLPCLKTRAVGAIPDLGGIDFTNVIVDRVVELAAERFGVSQAMLRSNQDVMNAIRQSCEEMKPALCERDVQNSIFIPGMDVPLNIDLTNSWFEESVMGFVDAFMDEVDATIRRGVEDRPSNLERLGIGPMTSDADIDVVSFIGGGSKPKVIRRAFAARHPVLADRIVEDVDPQFAVAIGASLIARRVSESSGEGTVPVIGRCRCSYGVSIHHPDDGRTYVHVHLWEGDPVPSNMEATYYIPDGAKGRVATRVYAIEGIDHSTAVCNPLFCNELAKLVVKTDDMVPGDDIQVDVEIPRVQLLRVTARYKGVEYPVDVELPR